MTVPTPPQFPAGEYVPVELSSPQQRDTAIEQLESAPTQIRSAISGLDEQQLDTKYRNWTIRQIVHHLADSHINCYVRFKWAITEDTPKIKSYDETAWSDVVDAKTLPLHSSLQILDGVHARWGALLRLFDEADWQRGFFHPEMERVVTLIEALPSYIWHTDHHVAQIQWVKVRRQW